MLVAIIIGAVLIAIGVFLLMQRNKALGHLLEIKFMETTPIAEIVDLQRSVSSELGSGGFSQLVETTGTAVADEPVTAELSGQPCAHYQMRVEERYEETYWERDAQGREVQRTRTGSNTVASNSRSARFYVQEGGARIPIDIDGAKLDLDTTVDRFEPAGSALEAISFGSFAMSLTPGDNARRVIGYHYSESVLPLGRALYVIGQASDTRGELIIRRPDDKSKPFIVSLKSEEEITEGVESKTRWLMIGAIACFVIGVGVIAMKALKVW